MQNILSDIQKAIENNESKENIRVMVLRLEGELRKLVRLQDIEKPERAFEAGDEQLERVKRNAMLYEGKPLLGLTPAVIAMQSNFKKFLSFCNLGAIADFSLQFEELVSVELSCGVTATSITIRDAASKALQAQIQVAALKENGIEFVGRGKFKDRHFKANESNFRIIREILYEIGAKHIRFETAEEINDSSGELFIRKLKFAIDTGSLLQLDREEFQVSFPKTEQLNPDEKNSAIKAIQQFSKAFNTYEQNSDNTDYQRILGVFLLRDFSTLCDAIELKTDLLQSIHWSSADEIAARAEALEIAENIGLQMTPEDIKRGYEDLYNALRQRSRETVMMSVGYPSIDPYGTMVELHFTDLIASEYGYDIDYQKFYSEAYDIIGTFGQNMLVKPTDRFYKKIQGFSDSIGGHISDIRIVANNRGMGVSSVKIFLPNLSCLAECVHV